MLLPYRNGIWWDSTNKYEVSKRVKISAVNPDQLADEIRAHPFEVFLARTDSTINRLAELHPLLF